jgi:hypothetical protein
MWAKGLCEREEHVLSDQFCQVAMGRCAREAGDVHIWALIFENAWCPSRSTEERVGLLVDNEYVAVERGLVAHSLCFLHGIHSCALVTLLVRSS